MDSGFSFLQINLTFHLFSLRVESSSRRGRCFRINGTISFTDDNDSGQALVDLQTVTEQVNCVDIGVNLPDMETIIEYNYAIVVMVLSVISFVIMMFDFGFGIYLYYQIYKYKKTNSKNGIPKIEYARHIKGWNLVVMAGDACTFFGTLNSYKMDVKLMLYKLDDNACLLGLGCLLSWISLARYMHFNRKFHLLFRTMYRAFFAVLAYLFCVGLLFCGFAICGYVVFGPYHNKFQTISNAADTLFATISGDEITVTLAAIESHNIGSDRVLSFAKIYLWLFVIIFTVFILNILIAIFNSAYDTIQKEYEEKKTNTDPLRRALLEFLKRENNTDMSPSENDLLKKLETIVKGNDTSSKPTVMEFMEEGGESDKRSCWRCHCLLCCPKNRKEDGETSMVIPI